MLCIKCWFKLYDFLGDKLLMLILLVSYFDEISIIYDKLLKISFV
jgi:hypothetical protein